MTQTHPTRHGDWHLINGVLVDLSQQGAPPSSPGPAQHAGRSETARASGSQAPPSSPPDMDVTGNDAGSSLPPAPLPSFPAAPPNKRRASPKSPRF